VPPRGSPSRHAALLVHESTVELSHSSSRGANRHSCHAEKSISIVRRDAPWHSLELWVALDTQQWGVTQCALPLSLGV
jgi:hypothetical protein